MSGRMCCRSMMRRRRRKASASISMIMLGVPLEVAIDGKFVLEFAAALDDAANKRSFVCVGRWSISLTDRLQPRVAALKHGLEIGTGVRRIVRHAQIVRGKNVYINGRIAENGGDTCMA